MTRPRARVIGSVSVIGCEKMDPKKVFTVLMALLLTILSTGIVSGDTATAYLNSHNSITNGDQWTNTSVLGSFYVGDDRVADYMWEDFDDTTYDFIDGLSCGWKAGGTSTGTCVDQSTLTDFFGDGGVIINSTDSASTFAMASKTSSAMYIDNSTLTDDVYTWEFDIMLEEDTEPFSMRMIVGGENIYLNLSVVATNMSVHQTQSDPHLGDFFEYNISSGEWHKVIVSVSDTFAGGFNVTVFIDGVSVSLGMSFQGIADNTGFSAIWFYLPAESGNSNDLGRNALMDNLIMYNGSFSEAEIYRAMTQTYNMGMITDLLPLIVTVAVFSMIIGVIGKLRFG